MERMIASREAVVRTSPLTNHWDPNDGMKKSADAGDERFPGRS
jgi:hypothetical protein